MQISPERLQAFIDAYEEDFGEHLSLSEATEMAVHVLSLFQQLAQPLPSEKKKFKQARSDITPASNESHHAVG